MINRRQSAQLSRAYPYGPWHAESSIATSAREARGRITYRERKRHCTQYQDRHYQNRRAELRAHSLEVTSPRDNLAPARTAAVSRRQLLAASRVYLYTHTVLSGAGDVGACLHHLCMRMVIKNSAGSRVRLWLSRLTWKLLLSASRAEPSRASDDSIFADFISARRVVYGYVM